MFENTSNSTSLSMRSCGAAVTKAIMDGVTKFSKAFTKTLRVGKDATHSTAGDSDNEETDVAARKLIAARVMADKFRRSQENIEKGRCNPHCAQVDILHSIAIAGRGHSGSKHAMENGLWSFLGTSGTAATAVGGATTAAIGAKVRLFCLILLILYYLILYYLILYYLYYII